MGLVWDSYVIYVGSPWELYWICMGCAWKKYWIPMGSVNCLHGVPMGYAGDSCGTCMWEALWSHWKPLPLFSGALRKPFKLASCAVSSSEPSSSTRAGLLGPGVLGAARGVLGAGKLLGPGKAGLEGAGLFGGVPGRAGLEGARLSGGVPGSCL